MKLSNFRDRWIWIWYERDFKTCLTVSQSRKEKWRFFDYTVKNTETAEREILWRTWMKNFLFCVSFRLHPNQSDNCQKRFFHHIHNNDLFIMNEYRQLLFLLYSLPPLVIESACITKSQFFFAIPLFASPVSAHS